MNSIQKISQTLKPIALATSLALATSGSVAIAGDNANKAHSKHSESMVEKWQGEAYQGWLDGKVETALLLNTNLNSFKINTKTENNVVTLFGEVNTEVQAELAEQIAKGVKGVEGVNNKLEVSAEAEQRADGDEGKSFSQHWNDATTTATVKSKLLLEDTIKGLDINVDTNYSVVSLKGTVRNDTERDLVEQIAENTASVKSVENQLKIDNS